MKRDKKKKKMHQMVPVLQLCHGGRPWAANWVQLLLQVSNFILLDLLQLSV